MATLRGTSGQSLIGDFGATLGAGFEAQNVRRRAAEDQEDLEGKLKAALGLGGPSSQVVDDAALGRLGQVSPQMAQAVGQASGNPQAAAELREQTQRGLTLSEELQALPDHAARLRRIAQEGGTVSAEGGDLSRLVSLSNLDEGQLDLELQRMQLIGNDVLSSLPPPPPSATDAFAALIADNPAVGTALLGRRDTQIANERARRAAEAKAQAAAAARASAPAGPQGPLAKGLAQIEHNLSRGFITQEQADARRARLTSEVASDPGVAAGLEIQQAQLDIQGTDLDNQILQAELAGNTDEVDALALEKAQLDNEKLRLGNDALIAEAQDPPADAKAPTTITQSRADGSSITMQWTPDAAKPQGGTWTPLATEGDAGTIIQARSNLTEGQAKMTLFNSLMTETAPVLNDIETQFNPANITDATARNTPIAGNFFISSEGQIYNSAAAAWAEGALRLATGAAATPEEIVRTRETYFAKPGDTPTTVSFKSDMRDMYSRAIDRALGADVTETLQTPDEFARGLVEVVESSGEFNANSVAAMSSEDLNAITGAQIQAMDTPTLQAYISAKEQ